MILYDISAKSSEHENFKIYCFATYEFSHMGDGKYFHMNLGRGIKSQGIKQKTGIKIIYEHSQLGIENRKFSSY